MELRDIKKNDYIVFTYGDPDYRERIVGKVISLSIPSKFKTQSVKDLDWKEKLNLDGYVKLMTTNGEEVTLCLAQAINGCTKTKRREFQTIIDSRIRNMTSAIERLKSL